MAGRIVLPVFILMLKLVTAHDVFLAQDEAERYQYPNVAVAREQCDVRNGRLATLDDMALAFEEGYDECHCGWIDDGTVALPVGEPRPGCGELKEIRFCPKNFREWGNNGWDAFCVKDRSVTCEGRLQVGAEVHSYADLPDDQGNIFLGLSFPYDGVVSGWEFQSLRSDFPVYVAVYRPQENDEFMTIGRTRLDTKQTGRVTYILKENEKFAVQKGDVVGVHYDSVISLKSRNFTVIPYATGSNNCDEDGHCVEEADQYDTWVFHRHEQQLFFKKNYVLKMKNVIGASLIKRAPALRPIFCAEGVTFTTESTTTSATSTTSEPPTTTARTTPEQTPEPSTTESPPTTTTEEPTTATEEPTTATEEPTTATEEPTTTTEEPTTTTEGTTTTTEAATTVNFGVTENGEGAGEEAETTVPCVFPFVYRDTEFYGCTEVMSAGKPWCSTEAVYSGQHWRYCTKDDKVTKDFPCKFPFKYLGKEYNECIMENSARPWCSVADNYSPHAWKYCDRVELKVEELPCHFPFDYNGKKQNMCTKAGSSNYWCSVTDSYQTWSWRNCRTGDRIPSEMPCQYPFNYQGQERNTCIYEGDAKPWCAVEYQYAADNWRYCRDGDVFPEVEPCVLPFLFNGKEISSCSYAGSERPWCALTREYDASKWRYCRKVDLSLSQDLTFKTATEAATHCKSLGMALASLRDVKDGWEMGNESCNCGWLSNGSAVQFLHNPRVDCGTSEGQRGVAECPAEPADGYIAICTLLS